MKLKSMLAAVIVLFLNSPLRSLGPIDKFVADRCADECNGESEACLDCYTTAVDLFDQSDPVSPELNFDIDEDHGKLEFEF